MSKRNLIITLIGLGIVGGLTIWYFSTNKTTTETTGTTSTSSPFGSSSGNKFVNINETPKVTTETGIAGETSTKKIPVLVKVYESPVSNSVLFSNKTNEIILRFIDRAVGNVYEYIPASNTKPIRLTKTTIAKVIDTVWSSKGDQAILRYLDNDTDKITSFSGKISPQGTSSEPTELTGSFLTSDISDSLINPAGSRIFSLQRKSSGGGSFGYTSIFDGTNKRQIFDSPITYWNISWPKENIITFTTKASSDYGGFLFFFNTQTESMETVLSNIVGLSTLTNNTADLIAYSQKQDDTFSLLIYDNKKKTVKNISLPTLAEKCVWGTNNSKILYCAIPTSVVSDTYPDAWYQGKVSFTDDIWKIDAEKEQVSLIYQIGSGGTNIDATELKISPDDKYISFMNKKDLSMWLLNVSEITNNQIFY